MSQNAPQGKQSHTLLAETNITPTSKMFTRCCIKYCVWHYRFILEEDWSSCRLQRPTYWGRHTANWKVLATENHWAPWDLLRAAGWNVLACAKWYPMRSHSCHCVWNRNCALMDLIMNVNHHCILLWWVSGWVQHTRRYIRWAKGSRLFYCLLLSIGEMVIVFILANRIMSRQTISPCSLTSNRRTGNALKKLEVI